jgi:hypothetical protein
MECGAVPDKDTREHREEANGQVVAAGAKFTVVGWKCDFPAADALSDAMMVQCRAPVFRRSRTTGRTRAMSRPSRPFSPPDN